MVKTFRSLRELKEHYFPVSTKKEQEEEFMRNATPEQIGKRRAEESIETARKALEE